MIRSPPPQAFRFPWHPQSQEQEDDEIIMSVLEDPPNTSSPSASQTQLSRVSTPELIDESPSRTGQVTSFSDTISFCHKILVFQMGLLVVALWIPSLHLPLIQLDYSGLAKEVMTASSKRVFLWQIPGIIWLQGIEAKTSSWVLMALCVVVASTLFIFPILATCFGIFCWISDEQWAIKSRYWLYQVQPAVGGIVFVLTLVAVLQALKPLSSFSIDGSSICEKFAKLVGDDCLVLTGHLMAGGHFYIAHSILLEAFVYLTLKWSML